jgi:hypothetical protein
VKHLPPVVYTHLPGVETPPDHQDDLTGHLVRPGLPGFAERYLAYWAPDPGAAIGAPFGNVEGAGNVTEACISAWLVRTSSSSCAANIALGF